MAKNKTKTYTAKKGDSFTDSAGRTGTVGFSTKTGKALADGESTKIKISANDKVAKLNPVIKNQNNLVQDTSAIRTKMNESAGKIDALNGTGAQTQATGVYGTPVKDVNGNVIGTEKFDTKTGKALEDPSLKTTPVEGNIQDKLGNKYSTSFPEGISYKLPEPKEGSQWVFDNSGKAFEMDAKGNVTQNQVANQEYQASKDAKTEMDQQNTLFDSMKRNLDTSYQVMIDNIKQKSQTQKKDMAELNSRVLAAKRVAGFRTGSTEYTPEIAMGILKNEEEEGIRRITEIDDQMTLAIAEATSAKNDKDLNLAAKKMETYSKLKKEKENAIIDIYKTYMDNQKYIADTKKALATEERATKDQALQDLKASADQLSRDYTAAKDKTKFINSLIETTGLTRETILSQINEAKINQAKDAKSLTVKGEKESLDDKISKISNSLSSDNTFTKDGEEISIIDDNGYINPDAWKYLIRNSGISRDKFIKEFGSYIYLDNYQVYGITPAEYKILTGKLPSNSNEDIDILD